MGLLCDSGVPGAPPLSALSFSVSSPTREPHPVRLWVSSMRPRPGPWQGFSASQTAGGCRPACCGDFSVTVLSTTGPWPVAECPEPSTPHVDSFLLFNNARLSLISYKPSSRSAERIGTVLTRLKRKNRPSVSRPHCSGGGNRVWQGPLSAGPRQTEPGTRDLLEQERQSGGPRKRTPPWGVGLA